MTANELHELGSRVVQAEIRACGMHGDVESAKLCRELWTILKLQSVCAEYPVVEPTGPPVTYSVFCEPDSPDGSSVFGS